ncbi:MAG TPA: HAD hydrolase family protein, partial [Dehalococcoidales bacterium]|nr:HAD hydrolase family protein [Dehalococcoidales bacterium]
MNINSYPVFKVPPQAIVLDLDGTLFNSSLQISDRNRRAVQACQARGLAVVIATSRAERSVNRWVDAQLLSRCSLVLLNGAIARGYSPLSGHTDSPISPD